MYICLARSSLLCTHRAPKALPFDITVSCLENNLLYLPHKYFCSISQASIHNLMSRLEFPHLVIWGSCQYIKPTYFQYGISHYKDKMVSRSSYLHNGNSHTWKYRLCIESRPSYQRPMVSFCWNNGQNATLVHQLYYCAHENENLINQYMRVLKSDMFVF